MTLVAILIISTIVLIVVLLFIRKKKCPIWNNILSIIISVLISSILSILVFRYQDPRNNVEAYYIDCGKRTLSQRYAILVINNNEYPIDKIIFDFSYSAKVICFNLYPENHYENHNKPPEGSVIFETKALSNYVDNINNNYFCTFIDLDSAIDLNNPNTYKGIKLRYGGQEFTKTLKVLQNKDYKKDTRLYGLVEYYAPYYQQKHANQLGAQ